ncbi:CYTH domain-containing protein [Flavihumibacter petaseus]|uniref:CYTH domain-containing protein n=1 Tax=Flavihumibacter petaseus NBRC 106054 TaxID=1220578 RepID=A0A0E9MYP4_9BACT|nr:CYTH domain-containing protein [Flavihumibacter petaseus]GAO42531.1 hypothetical protein FPE01S_01_15460 [Flavihumibacter petaseus NBRC 106054]
MGVEIERKFLVDDARWWQLAANEFSYLRQGYISADPKRIVRVRATEKEGFLTIKGISTGAARAEFEYTIPREDAETLLDTLCDNIIAKRRYLVEHARQTWEVDVFLGDNEGLIVAEIELDDENEQFELPGWIGREVTEEEKYYNASLSRRPFKSW